MYIFVSKIIKQKNPIKNQPKESWENSIISQCVVKLQNLIGRISVPSFDTQPFADVLQSKWH